LFAALYNAAMKNPRSCGSNLNLTAGLCLSLVFSVACAQNAAPESPAGSTQTEVVESVVTPAAAATGSEAAEPVGVASEEVVELVIVDSPVKEDVAISEPAVTEQVEVELPPAPVKPRYKKEDVLWIQQRLEELGYYTGAIDGSYGKGTREAIKAYQADQELEQDGRPTPELRDFMWRNGG
jgi:Putative peptidoglycan binding domain